MASISVAEAAARLGVGVARIHQRIEDGSLIAVRVGSQWVIDEAALSAVSELRTPGRPLSHRSAWALLACSRVDGRALEALAASERARARQRLGCLLAEARPDVQLSEMQVHAVAVLLRAWLRNRAERRVYRASPRDLPDLRQDARVILSGLSDARSGIASADVVEGYVAHSALEAVIDDYVLSGVPAGRDANVVIHAASGVIPEGVKDISTLLVAADLAEHRGPREEGRAAELLREMADNHPEFTVPRQATGGRLPKVHE